MKKSLKIICSIVILVVVAAGSFFMGRASVTDEAQPDSGSVYAPAFYATITEKRDSWLLVEGLEVNDINHRGAFTLSVDESTELVWHYTAIEFGDLVVGQTIAITYAGPVLESYPGIITQTLRIEVLDDDLHIAVTAEERTVIDIIDRTKTEPLVTPDVLEGFWCDDEYAYYFSSLKSGLIIVHYSDGSQEPVRDALGGGRITIADLDRFGIGYGKEPRVYITDIKDRDTGDTAVQVFFSGIEYYYYFPTIHETTVYYSDGTQQTLEEAMAELRVTIEDLDRFGIAYSRAPMKEVAEIHCQEGVLTALGHFWSDLVYDYYFPSMDTEVTVIFTDGTRMDITEALELGFVSIYDLDRFDNLYYRQPKK